MQFVCMMYKWAIASAWTVSASKLKFELGCLYMCLSQNISFSKLTFSSCFFVVPLFLYKKLQLHKIDIWSSSYDIMISLKRDSFYIFDKAQTIIFQHIVYAMIATVIFRCSSALCLFFSSSFPPHYQIV